MQVFCISLNTLQAGCKSRLHRFADRLDLFALLSEALEFLVAIVQFFQQSPYGLLVHSESDALSELELVA